MIRDAGEQVQNTLSEGTATMLNVSLETAVRAAKHGEVPLYNLLVLVATTWQAESKENDKDIYSQVVTAKSILSDNRG